MSERTLGLLTAILLLALNGGAQAAIGDACGGIANAPCGNGEYCQFPEGQCPQDVADLAGTCQAKPEICTKEYVPVCGCDGKTYGNKCEAAAAGVSVRAAGECTR